MFRTAVIDKWLITPYWIHPHCTNTSEHIKAVIFLFCFCRKSNSRLCCHTNIVHCYVGFFPEFRNDRTLSFSIFSFVLVAQSLRQFTNNAFPYTSKLWRNAPKCLQWQFPWWVPVFELQWKIDSPLRLSWLLAHALFRKYRSFLRTNDVLPAISLFLFPFLLDDLCASFISR